MKLKQFWLLTWKNFLLQWRHPWLSLLEIVVPIILAVVTVVLRGQISSKYVSEPTIFGPFPFDNLPQNATIFQGQVLYAPDDDDHYSKEIMENVERRIGSIEIKGYKNEKELEYAYAVNFTPQQQISTVAGVVFEQITKELRSNIVVKIRPKALPIGEVNSIGKKAVGWYTSLTFPVFQLPGPRSDRTWGGEPGYMSQGFLTVQNAIGNAIIECFAERNNITGVPDQLNKTTVQLQRFPYPPYNDDLFLFALQFFLPMIFMFTYIFPVMSITKNLVFEKERRLKESMKMMGLATWLHWIAWFVKSAVLLFISTVIITILFCTSLSGSIAVLDKSNPLLIFFFLITYCFSSISFSFLMSTFFSKANISGAGAGIIFFISFVPYAAVFAQYNVMSGSVKVLLCLISNTALSFGCMLLAMWEGTGAGAHWKYLNLPVSPDDTLTLGTVIGMMLLDGIIYLLLTWYIDAVNPGDFGIPQPFYFPFTKAYWFGSITEKEDDTMHERYISTFNGSFSEDIGIKIIGLSKVYDRKKGPVVKNISLNMQVGEITALLGHNGAGKSTTISMLTGLFPPTSGTALINGYDIRFDIDKIHTTLGICPQHDVLFDDLTVKEHLYFFAKLKNCPQEHIQEEVEKMLIDIGLIAKRDSLASTLSGGMKRKLSIGIALIAGSKIVILDEPTSGMDPSARRFAWDLLQREKQKRTILLTTHFMEEADILADYIAIMVGGNIQCEGTSLNLKKRFGAGYRLVIVKEPKCKVEEITNLVHSYVPEAILESNVGAELTFSLPHGSSHLFEKLFHEIETNKQQLLISSYGASITTMEEVFLKVGEYSSEGMESLKYHDNSLTNSTNSIVTYVDSDNGYRIEDFGVMDSSRETKRNTGLKLFLQQTRALLVKKILHTYRNIMLTTSQLIIPSLLLALLLSVLHFFPSLMPTPPLELTLSPFKGSVTVLHKNCSSDFSSAVIQQYRNYLSSDVDKVDNVVDLHGNILDYLVNIGKSDIGDFTFHYILSTVLECDDSEPSSLNIKALFNNQPYHSPAIAVSALQNSILDALLNSTKYKITTINHPLPKTDAEKAQNPLPELTAAYQISQNLIVGMSFLVASFSVFIVKELSSKTKHLQKVSGVNLFTFWATTFFWDMLTYLVPCILIMLVFVAFGTEGLSTAEMQGYLFLLFVFHGFAALMLMYNLSFLFEVPATAYISLSIFYILYGNVCLLVVSIMKIPQLGSIETSKMLDRIFSIFSPSFCFGRSVGSLYNNYEFNKACDKLSIYCDFSIPAVLNYLKPCCKGKCGDECLDRTDNYLAWELPGIGSKLTYLCIQFVIFAFVLMCIELNVPELLRHFTSKIPKFRKIITPSDSEEYNVVEDEDVEEERHRIHQTALSRLRETEMLVFYDITKYYEKNCAVDQLSFGIRKGECFGLLGLNGAGKTTTFKMLTGDIAVSSGDAYLEGYSVKSEIRQIQQRIGYCPQFGGLIDCLTGREMLTLFARLRGVQEGYIQDHVVKLGEMLYFTSHIDRIVKGYSGGTQRKLSTAVALIGDPPVVLLDEPSSGMDPVARRHLWNTLLTVLRSGRSIILTSHSMEECEALCSRLVIMVNGKLCCLGSPQHLKSKYGQGYTLLMKVQRDPLFANVNVGESQFESRAEGQGRIVQDKNINRLHEFIQQRFPSSTLKESHGGFFHYNIADPKMTWAQLFGIMEGIKTEFSIEDYSIGQTTLEQIFLNFARKQR